MPRFKAISEAGESAPDGLLPAEITQLTHYSVLRTTIFVMGFLTLGIVCLMTTKPGWISAPAIMAVAFVAALIAAQLPLGAARAVPSTEQPSHSEAALEESTVN